MKDTSEERPSSSGFMGSTRWVQREAGTCCVGDKDMSSRDSRGSLGCSSLDGARGLGDQPRRTRLPGPCGGAALPRSVL